MKPHEEQPPQRGRGLLLRACCWAVLALGMGMAAEASSSAVTDLEPGTYLDRWLVVGPVPIPSEEAPPRGSERLEAFDTNHVDSALRDVSAGMPLEINGESFAWEPLESARPIADLTAHFGETPFAMAYAYAEIVSPEAREAVLAIGSGGSVKVWVNGQEVHRNWTLRPVRKDQDLVPVDLKAGTNRVLVKVQNHGGEWAFACRILAETDYPRQLFRRTVEGGADAVEVLLDHGADPARPYAEGVTPVHMARVTGREDILQLMEDHGGDPGEPPPRPEAMAKALFAALSAGGPGMAALVGLDGAIEFEGYHGLANAQHEVPVTADTPFRIASLTKPFTAAAVLALAEAGRLDLDDPVSKHLPGYPNGDAITLHHLLTHSAGIPNYTAKPEFLERASLPWTPEEIAALFKDEPLEFEPGERYSYSNSGYYLLGQIVEEVTGKSFEAYLSKRFFEPLDMRHSGMHDPRAILPQAAQGYTIETGALKNAQEWHTPNAGGAGGMYSTVRDLHRWVNALFQEDLLTGESLEGVFEGVFMGGVPPEGLPDGLPAYGHGWVITEHRGLSMLNHMGGLPGFTSIMAHYPEQDLTVVVLSNCAPPHDLSPEQVLLTLAQCFLWEAMEDAHDPDGENG